MMFRYVKSIVIVMVLGLLPFLFKGIEYEHDKCPFCYGEDFCHAATSSLRIKSIRDIFNNLFSVKNVFFASDAIVLKKLAHSKDLEHLDGLICMAHGKSRDCDLSMITTNEFNYMMDLKRVLHNSEHGYRLCGLNSVDRFISNLMSFTKTKEDLINVWTIAQINIEPLVLKMFENDTALLPLPNYYGACGRVIAVENCGRNLNDFMNADWHVRAIIARGIINSVLKFTDGSSDFRIYLTDVSPDNIAINEETLDIKFIDFGDIIIVEKANGSLVHTSVDYTSINGFAYSEEDVCLSSISDHNIYSACKLLLSAKAPWPMMEGGLLHSIPDEVNLVYPDLVELIELCVQPIKRIDRFQYIQKLDDILRDSLNNNGGLNT